jgi:polyribonucleotide nucleotidyltransferase
MKSLVGGKRVNNPEEVVSVGQKIQVEIAEVDNRGKISLQPVVEEGADGAVSDDVDAAAGEPVATASE